MVVSKEANRCVKIRRFKFLATGRMVAIFLYWGLLLVAAACVVVVSGSKRTVSLIVLAPLVLFGSLLLLQTVSFMGSKMNINTGPSVMLVWVITALLFMLAIVMWVLQRRHRKVHE